VVLDCFQKGLLVVQGYPEEAMKTNSSLFGVLTERGGHLGFMQNSGILGLSNRTWDEELASKWLLYMRGLLLK
jgi:predicted alpha/beta-fold hydrolase